MKTALINSTKVTMTFMLSLLLSVGVLAEITIAADHNLYLSTSEYVRDVQTFEDASGAQASVSGLFNAATGAPVRVQGLFTTPVFESLPTTEEMLAFINDQQNAFGIGSGNLEIIYSGEVLGKSFLTARQLVDGRPVLGTQVVLRAGSTGRVALWGADVVSSQDQNWNAQFTPEQASELLVRELAFAGATTTLSCEEVWTRAGNQITPAYQIRLLGSNADEYVMGLVEAKTGLVLGITDLIFHAGIRGTVTGSVYQRNPFTPLESRPISKQFVTADGEVQMITDSAGTFEADDLAEGEHYVEMVLENDNFIMRADEFSMRPGGGGGISTHSRDFWAATDEEISFDWSAEEDFSITPTHAFHHLNLIHDWWEAMDPELDILNATFHVYVDQNGEQGANNAFYMPGMAMYNLPHGIYLGEGSGNHSNFGQVADIAYHEFTHSVNLELLDYGMQGELGAMHEGFSDFFAGAIINSPDMGVGLYQDEPERVHRTLSNDLMYPDDLEGESHHDGLIIGGAVWNLREILGSELADPLIHYARYGRPSTFEAYLEELLVLDDDNDDLSDGTPHWIAILAAFTAHGIGGDWNHIADPGSHRQVTLPQSSTIQSTYPNPFNSSTTIQFNLAKSSSYSLNVFDLSGRHITLVQKGYLRSGNHTAIWNARSLPSGQYYLHLNTPAGLQMMKVVLTK